MENRELKIKGIDEIISKMNSLYKKFPNFIRGILHNIGLQALSKVRKLTPVDTGNLRSKWHINEPKISDEEATIEIKNNAEYATPVEYGHRTRGGGFVQGRFMLRRAFDEIERSSNLVLENAIARFVKRNLE